MTTDALDFPDDEPPTSPDGPSALRRSTTPPKPSSAWAFERESGTGRVCAVKVICAACCREVVMRPPRFTVDEQGEVLAVDEGAAFRCTVCAAQLGPLILAEWRLGRMA